MVENIYRHLSVGLHAEQTVGERILHAADEIQRSLFFSTAVMVCAFLPLFTMEGPEGQIFGPMADTYAFALGGALLLALLLSPVLCELLLRNIRPGRRNLLVRGLTASYLQVLKRMLEFRWFSLGLFAALWVLTAAVLPQLGREFMPELEEGNMWIRSTYPLNASLDEVTRRTQAAMKIMKQYPEVRSLTAQIGRPDDGTDATSFYSLPPP
jgi:heavy metal efflux system protein